MCSQRNTSLPAALAFGKPIHMSESPAARLSRQIEFIAECDKLKEILRQTLNTQSRRAENDAEHSWHLCLCVIVLAEHANAADLDVLRVLKMVIVHDLVEIDAGDTFAYDTTANETKAAREQAAAERIFGLLPPDQAAWFRACWDEFEANQTTEAMYANALDRFQALLLNMKSGGGSWQSHRISRADVLRRMAPVEKTLPELWPFVVDVVDRFCESGAIAT